MKKITVASLKETEELGNKLGKLLDKGALVVLSGDLGAGKTTFTKSIGKALGVKKVINSPTFTILKSYKGRIPFHHIDAYRLEGVQQDLGFEELFDGEGVCVVEWPAFIEEFLPKERLEVEISRIDEEKRLFTFYPRGSRYEAIVEELS